MCQIVFIPILIPSIHVCSQRQLHSSPCGFRKTPSRHTYHLHSKDFLSSPLLLSQLPGNHLISCEPGPNTYLETSQPLKPQGVLQSLCLK
ncbi:hypothetical protein ILYODFUR_019624 [Ilyodon furcidens]|uniref:Uncharacterized protein n=1 Tax=Ilyodon furcidens TaxID=33524 RepID=A0ABV0UHG6_9TELE